MASPIAALSAPQGATLYVFFIGSDGHVYEQLYESGGWTRHDAGSAAGFQPAVSNALAATFGADGTPRVYFISSRDGGLYQLDCQNWQVDPVQSHGASGAIPQSQIAALSQGGAPCVYYIGGVGLDAEVGLYQDQWKNGQWNPTNLSAGRTNPPLPYGLLSLIALEANNGQPVLYFNGGPGDQDPPDPDLYALWVVDGTPENLTTETGTTAPNPNSPLAGVWGPESLTLFYLAGTDLWALVVESGEHMNPNLTTETGAKPPQRLPGGFAALAAITAGDDDNVYFLGTDGNIWEITHDREHAAWLGHTITQAGAPAPVADTLLDVTLGDDGLPRVYYFTDEMNIAELRPVGNGKWASQRLPST